MINVTAIRECYLALSAHLDERGRRIFAATEARTGGHDGITASTAKDPTLLADLLVMVEPDARGDPMSPLRWTCKSLSHLARGLVAMGHQVGRSAVGALLH